MAFIRVGYFEDFKGADTLLVDIDHEGPERLDRVASRGYVGRPKRLRSTQGATRRRTEHPGASEARRRARLVRAKISREEAEHALQQMIKGDLVPREDIDRY
jgi:hypothetical protein